MVTFCLCKELCLRTIQLGLVISWFFNKILTMPLFSPLSKTQETHRCSSPHKVALTNFRMTPREESIAREGVVFALCALQRQVSDPKARTLSLKKPKQNLMQNAFLATQINIAKQFKRIVAAIPTDMFGNSSKLD